MRAEGEAVVESQGEVWPEDSQLMIARPPAAAVEHPNGWPRSGGSRKTQSSAGTGEPSK